MIGLSLNDREFYFICLVQDRTFLAPHQDSPTMKTLTKREDGGMMKRPSRSGPGPRVIEAVLRCGVCVCTECT